MSLILMVALLTADPEVSTARTKHYEVRAVGMDAAEVGRMLEPLHRDLTRHFGRAPEGRLRVEIYEDQKQFEQAIIGDRQPFMGGGGYYAPSNRKAYVYRQPSEYFTRQLILHEATHQFHWLVATRNKTVRAHWYVEGLAEYFGMHNWDGRTLKTGVVPAITLEDYPALALKAFDGCDGDLEGIIAGKAGQERPVGWSLVHFLINNQPRRFAALAKQLDQNAEPLQAWKEVLGPITPELTNRYRTWLQNHAQPWHEVWRAWQQRGDTLEGRSKLTALCVLKKTPARLSATMQPIEGKLRAGLVFGYVSPDQFQMVQVFDNSRAWLIDRVDGQWRNLRTFSVPAAENHNLVQLTRNADKVSISVNGREIATVDADGQVGLNTDNCHVRFRVQSQAATEPAE